MSAKKTVTPSEVSVREFRREDIPEVVSYWTENSEEFWRARGVDKSKLKSKEENLSAFYKMFAEKGGVPTMVSILLNGKAIGVHGLTDLVPGESGIFHAHIWQEEHRGQGVAVYSYLLGAEYFIKSLNLKKIIFKTPKINEAANRLKVKIGIPMMGDTICESPLLFKPLPASLYELTPELIKKLKVQHGL